MTAEEFFRNKIKEKNPITEVVTLSTYLVTAEEAMLWAYEFNKLEKSEKPINLEGNKTAVQWFANQLGITTGTMLEQAIAMEKEQHKDTYVAAMARPAVMDINPFDQAEQYFNQTYNKNKQ